MKQSILKPGCYLMEFRPTTDTGVSYRGTLRVTQNAKDPNAKDSTAAPSVSGDLYAISSQVRSSDSALPDIPALADMASKAKGIIPCFPSSAYSHYLDVYNVTDIEQNPGEIRVILELQAHRFDHASRRLAPGANCRLQLTEVKPSPAQTGNTGPTFSGDLIGPAGKRGDFTLVHIGEKLRRAKVRIFALEYGANGVINFPGSKLVRKNLDDQADASEIELKWQSVFSKVGWDLNVESKALKSEGEFQRPDQKPTGDPPKIGEPDSNIDEWTPFDLAVNATQLRSDIVGNNDDWIYDLLCVSRFEKTSNFLGLMFDSDSTDLNQRPRESAAISALRQFTHDDGGKPVTEPFQRARDGELYFRTAIHEIGHCMNLTHSLSTQTLMDTTDCLLSTEAKAAANGNPKKAVKLEFLPEDAFWLQHAPDIAIRPGGVSRHNLQWQRKQRSQTTTVLVKSQTALTLDIKLVDNKIPFGAPARLDITLSNQGEPTLVPADISLRGGCVSGSVHSPNQSTAYFRSAFKCCDSVKPDGRLEPLADKPKTDGLTLLRGIDSPLFPRPGKYRIELVLRWDVEGQTRQVTGSTSIVVLPPNPKDSFQTLAAAAAINQPLLMPAIVQGRLVKEGIVPLGLTLASTELAPHYEAIALRCFNLSNQSEHTAIGPEDIKAAMEAHGPRFGQDTIEKAISRLQSKAKAGGPTERMRMTCREKKRFQPSGKGETSAVPQSTPQLTPGLDRVSADQNDQVLPV